MVYHRCKRQTQSQVRRRQVEHWVSEVDVPLVVVEEVAGLEVVVPEAFLEELEPFLKGVPHERVRRH